MGETINYDTFIYNIYRSVDDIDDLTAKEFSMIAKLRAWGHVDRIRTGHIPLDIPLIEYNEEV